MELILAPVAATSRYHLRDRRCHVRGCRRKALLQWNAVRPLLCKFICHAISFSIYVLRNPHQWNTVFVTSYDTFIEILERLGFCNIRKCLSSGLYLRFPGCKDLWVCISAWKMVGVVSEILDFWSMNANSHPFIGFASVWVMGSVFKMRLTLLRSVPLYGGRLKSLSDWLDFFKPLLSNWFRYGT